MTDKTTPVGLNTSDAEPNYASRAPFEPLGTEAVAGQQVQGSAASEHLAPLYQSTADGLPGALSFWNLDNGVQGVFENARTDGASLKAYQLLENQALLMTQTPTREGPDGTPNSALSFNGENSFAFVEHERHLEMTQGTVALWVQPDSLDDDMIVLSKDEKNSGDGGHFRLGIYDDGRVFVRFAEGDGGSNHAWTSSKIYFEAGQWTHIAVSFTDEGMTVYADGVAIPDSAWYREEGNLDSPRQASEAYLLQNQEPWVIGADTSRAEFNDTAAQFATDAEQLRQPFDGAIAQLGVWGGFDTADALDSSQVWQLFVDGPGTALGAPSGEQAHLAGDDVLDGEAGNDHLQGGAGDDELLGGAGSDHLEGGYGDDILDGGDDNDVLDGGRGSDLLLGGDGDDLLISRSDAGEQRIGQLAVGEPTRGDPDNEVNPLRQKLYGWEDQPLVADDILVGGLGNDTFLINPLINAKRDIILEHVNDDRSIDWANVAGENNELHEHWVDSFGIDLIADYNASEDHIVIIGHTADPQVTHKLIDTDGDGIDDELISIISVYSNQHGNGGAHDKDLMGQVVVFGDLVDEDDLVVDAGVTHGIVDTVDQIGEALAPTGDSKVTTIDGQTVYGYDTRDSDANLGAIVEAPELYMDNPYLNGDRYQLASNTPADVPTAVAVLDSASHPVLEQMNFDGSSASVVNIEHSGRATQLAQSSGTFAFVFAANAIGDKQTLFSKDARNYVDGGHLTASLSASGDIEVRYQSTEHSVYLKTRDVDFNPGEAHHFAFSFDADSAELYIDGLLRDTEDLTDKPQFQAGMTGNTESLVFGASTTTRNAGQLDNLKEFFDGTIVGALVLDRELYANEVFKLAEGVLQYRDSSGSLINELANEPPAADEYSDGIERIEVLGSDANDKLAGTIADEYIVGGIGNDTVFAGAGSDYVDAGDGRDKVLGGRGDDLILGGKGRDVLKGDKDDDKIHGGEDGDQIGGGSGNDMLFGEAGTDSIYGADGNDYIDGGEGNDLISAGKGEDILIGGPGDDIMRGGSQRDIFAYVSAGDDTSFGLDTLRDFRSTEDAIALSDDLQIQLSTGTGDSKLTIFNSDGNEVGAIQFLDEFQEDDLEFVSAASLSKLSDSDGMG